MNPQLEYYLRNNVSAPYIHHGSGKALLHNPLQSRSYDRYRLVDINSVNKGDNDGVNIGRFNVTIFVPHKSSTIFNNSNNWTVYWSEYPSFIESRVNDWRELNYRAISNLDELKVACWELLAYSQDSRFAELSMEILDLNCLLLDFNISISTRAALVDKLIKCMSCSGSNHYNYKSILESWADLNRIIHSSYAHWLAKLVNR